MAAYLEKKNLTIGNRFIDFIALFDLNETFHFSEIIPRDVLSLPNLDQSPVEN